MTRLAPVPDRPRRFAAYIRVSMIGARGDDIMSPDLQLAAATAWCERHGAELVEVVEDIDRSGRSWRPRQIGPLVDRVAAGELDGVIVWKWSRFARNRVDWAVHVDRMESAGGTLASATEDVDTSTSAGRFARGMLAELAAFESERIGEGWKDVQAARFAAGLPPGKFPWGWRRAGRGIEPHPDRAPIIVNLYRRREQGVGFDTLARELNAAGIASPTGVLWNSNVLRRLLDNPVHAGFVVHNGEVRPGAHDALITPEQWERYQAGRRWAAGQNRRVDSPFLLSGLAVCGTCDHALTGGGRSRTRGAPQYRCQHALKTGAHPHRSISVRRVEGQVMAWLAGLAEDIDKAVDRAPAPPALVPDMDHLAAQLLAADRKLAALELRRLDTPPLPEPAYRIAAAELLERRATLAAQLAAERDRRALADPAPRAAACALLAEWDELTVAAQRAALRSLIRRVVVHLGPDWRVVVEAST